MFITILLIVLYNMYVNEQNGGNLKIINNYYNIGNTNSMVWFDKNNIKTV